MNIVAFPSFHFRYSICRKDYFQIFRLMYKISLPFLFLAHCISFRYVKDFSFSACYQSTIWTISSYSHQPNHGRLNWRVCYPITDHKLKSIQIFLQRKWKKGHIYWKPLKAKLVHNKESNTAYNHQEVKVNPYPSPFSNKWKLDKKNSLTDYANCSKK